MRMLYHPSGSAFFLLKGFKSAAFQFPAFGTLGTLCECVWVNSGCSPDCRNTRTFLCLRSRARGAWWHGRLQKQLNHTWVSSCRTNAWSAFLSCGGEKLEKRSFESKKEANSPKGGSDIRSLELQGEERHWPNSEALSSSVKVWTLGSDTYSDLWPFGSRLLVITFAHLPPQRQCNNLSFQLSVSHSLPARRRGRIWLLIPFVFIYLSCLKRWGLSGPRNRPSLFGLVSHGYGPPPASSPLSSAHPAFYAAPCSGSVWGWSRGHCTPHFHNHWPIRNLLSAREP